MGDNTTFIKSSSSYTSNGNYINSVTDASGNNVAYNINQMKGNLNSFTDTKGKVTSYLYDNMDRLTDVFKTADGQEVRNTYSYLNDKIDSISHNGFQYNFDYDSLGNTNTVSVGSQILVSNTYQPRTSLLLSTDYGNGQSIGFNYDELYRPKTKSYNGIEKYKYEYDASGNLGYYQDLVDDTNSRYIYDLANRLVKVKDSQFKETNFAYDLNNNINKLSQKINGNWFITKYRYNFDNRPISTQYYRPGFSEEEGEYFPLNYDTIGSKGTVPLYQCAAFEKDEHYRPLFASYTSVTDVIATPSFEASFASNEDPQYYFYGWTFRNWGSTTGSYRGIRDAVDGLYSTELYDSDGLNKGSTVDPSIYQNISFPSALTSQSTITITTYAKRIGTAQPVISVNCYGQNFTEVKSIPENQWTKISLTFNAPIGATGFTFYLKGNGIKDSDVIRYDGVSYKNQHYLVKNPTKLAYDMGTIPSGTISTWFNKEYSTYERYILAFQENSSSRRYNQLLALYIDPITQCLKVKINNGTWDNPSWTDIITTNEAIQSNAWYFTSLSWKTIGGLVYIDLRLNNSYYISNTSISSSKIQNGNFIVSVGSAITYDQYNPEPKGTKQFNGYMEKLSFFKRAFNQQETFDLYQRGKDTIADNIYDSLGRLESNTINTGYNHFTTMFLYIAGSSNSSTNMIRTITNNGSSISYTYDANGNIETIVQGGQTIRYYYNELNEVIREDNQVLNKTITYSYDQGGNFTSKIEYPYTTGVPANPTKTYIFAYDGTWKDLLTNYDGNAITYDSIGNPLTYNGWTYTWEMGRQLATAAGNGYNISYKYNDAGIRTSKTVNGVTTNYHLVGDRVTYQTDGTDSIYFTYDANGKLVSMNLNGIEYYYIFNGQGDVIGLFDVSGTQVVSYTYDTWGKLVSTTGTLASTVGVKNPYRYRGYRYDTETGLYYLNSRYYNPEWGRFINADTIDNSKPGVLLSFNLFAYCYNNPVLCFLRGTIAHIVNSNKSV